MRRRGRRGSVVLTTLLVLSCRNGGEPEVDRFVEGPYLIERIGDRQPPIVINDAGFEQLVLLADSLIFTGGRMFEVRGHNG
jgi:hypothetical protein